MIFRVKFYSPNFLSFVIVCAEKVIEHISGRSTEIDIIKCTFSAGCVVLHFMKKVNF